jgi:tRNA (mo5U34)-methyltransferase
MACPTREQIEALAPWEQKIHFPNGVTVGAWDAERFDLLYAGVDLAGKTAFDIGCNAGNQTLRMERAGALVTGSFDVDPLHERQFALVKQAFDLRAEYETMSVYDIPSDRRADVVLFAGVLYHLHDPLRGLIRAWGATREVLLLETDSFPDDDRPVALFVKNESLWQYANWWLPTPRCVLDMVGSLDDVADVRDVTPYYPGWLGNRMALQIRREGAQ